MEWYHNKIRGLEQALTYWVGPHNWNIQLYLDLPVIITFLYFYGTRRKYIRGMDGFSYGDNYQFSWHRRRQHRQSLFSTTTVTLAKGGFGDDDCKYFIGERGRWEGL